MELRHLRYFVAVAEELHFGRAAARLRIVQPALSRQIRDLEEELGCALFVRDRRKVSLTPAGRAFRRDVQRIQVQVGDAVETARRAARGQVGRLRIGYVPSVATSALARIVRDFCRRSPGVDVRLSEMTPAAQVRELLAGRLELGFARGPLLEPGLAHRAVEDEPLVAALPSSHPLARRRVVRLGELREQAFVLPARARGPGAHDQILALCRAAGFAPRILHQGSQLDALMAAGAGIGVALVPLSLRRHGVPGVVYRALRERPRTTIVAAWSGLSPSPTVRAFLDGLTTVRRANRA